MQSLRKDTRILVTGGAGFIGSNMVEYLLANNCQVVCVDNFSTGLRQNVQPFLDNGNFTLIEGDICDEMLMCRATENIDYVIHLAALGSVPRSIHHPVQSFQTNITGTASVFFAAVKNHVKRVVYASSSSVYGDNSVLPKKEGDEGNPLSPYALSKCVDEQLAALFHRLYGLDVIGLRYFNVFGPRQNPDSAYAAVIPKFATAMLQGESPIVNGSLDISRDFTFVQDVVQANVLALFAENIPESARAINISGDCEYSLGDLICILQRAFQKSCPSMSFCKPVVAPARAGDIPHSKADISLARRVLHYEPSFSFELGIEKTVLWLISTQKSSK